MVAASQFSLPIGIKWVMWSLSRRSPELPMTTLKTKYRVHILYQVKLIAQVHFSNLLTWETHFVSFETSDTLAFSPSLTFFYLYTVGYERKPGTLRFFGEISRDRGLKTRTHPGRRGMLEPPRKILLKAVYLTHHSFLSLAVVYRRHRCRVITFHGITGGIKKIT